MKIKIKIFNKEKKFKKKDFNLNPNKYWKFAVGLTAVLMLFSFFFGYYLFARVEKNFFSASVEAQHTPILSEERIGRALDYFSGLEKRSAEILSSPAPVVDPSL